MTDDHDIIIRIDERTKRFEEDMEDIKFKFTEMWDKFADVEDKCGTRAMKCAEKFGTQNNFRTQVRTVAVTIITVVSIIGTAYAIHWRIG